MDGLWLINYYVCLTFFLWTMKHWCILALASICGRGIFEEWERLIEIAGDCGQWIIFVKILMTFYLWFFVVRARVHSGCIVWRLTTPSLLLFVGLKQKIYRCCTRPHLNSSRNSKLCIPLWWCGFHRIEGLPLRGHIISSAHFFSIRFSIHDGAWCKQS